MGLTSSVFADALDRRGIWISVDPRIVRMNGQDTPLFGRAYTVHWEPTRKMADIKSSGPSTWSEVRDFLVPDIEDGTGLVYVGGSGPLITNMALAGGMSCSYFEKIRLEGVILGGAVRDAAVVKSVGMPVYATNFVPADTQGAYRATRPGQSTFIGSASISTGDWIFADASGIVVIPMNEIDAVLDEALHIAEAEAAVMDAIRTGMPLHQVVDQGGHI